MRSSHRLWVLPCLFCAVLLMVFLLTSLREPIQPESRGKGDRPTVQPVGTYVGARVPGLSLSDPEGVPTALSPNGTGPLLLIFWSRWSAEGRAHLLALEAAVQRGLDVKTLAVAVGDHPTPLRIYLSRYPVHVSVVADPEGVAGHMYRINPTRPLTILTDSQGVVRSRVCGKLTAGEFLALVRHQQLNLTAQQ